MAHTPGPWTVGELGGDFGKDVMVFSSGVASIAAVYPTNDHFDKTVKEPERDANAQLIAAAPDLLAACQAALNDRMYKDWPGIADLLIAAIAKAEGR